MRKRVIAGVVAVAVVAGLYLFFKPKANDEGPIIVKNGSMTVETGGTWADNGATWRNDTGQQHHNELWVMVRRVDGQVCEDSGRPVHIDYSDTALQANFNVTGGSDPRTVLAPKGGFTRESSQRLRHGSQGDGGYITGVRVGSTALNCGLTATNLQVICIWSTPSGNPAECR
jgi:hypothetical protein